MIPVVKGALGCSKIIFALTSGILMKYSVCNAHTLPSRCSGITSRHLFFLSQCLMKNNSDDPGATKSFGVSGFSSPNFLCLL